MRSRTSSGESSDSMHRARASDSDASFYRRSPDSTPTDVVLHSLEWRTSRAFWARSESWFGLRCWLLCWPWWCRTSRRACLDPHPVRWVMQRAHSRTHTVTPRASSRRCRQLQRSQTCSTLSTKTICAKLILPIHPSLFSPNQSRAPPRKQSNHDPRSAKIRMDGCHFASAGSGIFFRIPLGDCGAFYRGSLSACR